MPPATGRRLGAAGAAALLGLALSACAASEEPSTSASSGASGASSGAIPIGVDIELSGPASVQGTAYKNALELYASQVNDDGGVLDGRKIDLIIRDNKSDPTQSVQIAKGFIDNDHVVGIVGGGTSPTTLSLADTVEAAGVPTVSMGSSDAIVNPVAKRQYLFKTPADNSQVAALMVKDMQDRGFRTVGFIGVDNAYGESGLTAFRAAAEAAGITVTGTEKFAPTDKDFTAQLTNLVAASPDAIVSWAIPPGAGIVAQNARSSGFDGQLYFDAGAGAELFLKGAGDAANGVFMIHPTVLVADEAPEAAPGRQQMEDFYQAYTDEYGAYSGFASYAADALGLLVAAIEKAGSTDGAEIRTALEGLDYTGTGGAYLMTAQDHSGLTDASMSLLTVKDGAWTLADSVVNERK
jgi:branched-chain amino acid transport system substrate-binding protein